MAFGVRNTAQTFQRFMNTELSDLDFVFYYLGDNLIASPDTETHEIHLELVFEDLVTTDCT